MSTPSPRVREAALELELAGAHARLEALGRLHSPTVGGLCAACLLPHPCPSAEIVLGRGTDTEGDSVT